MPEYIKVEKAGEGVVYREGSAEDCTHVILSIEEYQNFKHPEMDSEKLTYYKNQISIEKEYNRNLIRIATERANRKNGVSKKNNGYLMLKWHPVPYKNRKGVVLKSFQLYSVTFQTPHDCSLPLNVVDKKVVEALETGQILLQEDVEYGWHTNPNNTINDSLLELATNEYQFIVERRYLSNVVKGTWEIEFITNFAPQVLQRHRAIYI